MTDPEEQDSRELGALRFAAEQELLVKNRQLADVLVSLGITPDVEQAFQYLNTFDEETLRVISDPNSRGLFASGMFIGGPLRDPRYQHAIEIVETKYFEFDEAYGKLGLTDPVILKDILSCRRAQALIARHFERLGPVTELTKSVASYLIELHYQLNIKDELPPNVRNVMTGQEIADEIRSLEERDLISDLTVEETERIEKKAAEATGLTFRSSDYADMVWRIEHEDRLRDVYKEFPRLIPDIRVFIEHAFNAREGKLPI